MKIYRHTTIGVEYAGVGGLVTRTKLYFALTKEDGRLMTLMTRSAFDWIYKLNGNIQSLSNKVWGLVWCLALQQTLVL